MSMQTRQSRSYYLNRMNIDEWVLRTPVHQEADSRLTILSQAPLSQQRVLLIGDKPIFASTMAKCLEKACIALNVFHQQLNYVCVLEEAGCEAYADLNAYTKSAFAAELDNHRFNRVVIFSQALKALLEQNDITEASFNTQSLVTLPFAIDELLIAKNKKALYLAMSNMT